jgi:hypothetical protein
MASRPTNNGETLVGLGLHGKDLLLLERGLRGRKTSPKVVTGEMVDSAVAPPHGAAGELDGDHLARWGRSRGPAYVCCLQWSEKEDGWRLKTGEQYPDLVYRWI